jgi:DNA polymerase-3 subunit epsilon
VDFVVIDVETANPDSSSICQVGIASFRDGKLADSWGSLVNPEDDFNSFNVAIHGIDEDQVRDAPTWEEVFPQVHARLRDSIVVSHTTFDRTALRKACDRASLTVCEYTWLDSTRVVRMTWPQFSKAGYGLTNLARHFGIAYQAHDALEDARCAGILVLRAMAETGLSPRQWLARAAQPMGPTGPTLRPSRSYPEQVKRDGNPQGELFGEVLVFTGSLSISRPEAADAAAAAGCSVESGVTRHTTMLVVGGRNVQRLAGHQKSSKHLIAEQLIARGQAIRILGESDFLHLVARAGTQQVSELSS